MFKCLRAGQMYGVDTPKREFPGHYSFINAPIFLHLVYIQESIVYV